MKGYKPVTYLMAGMLGILLLMFVVKVGPRLLAASRPTPVTQTSPTMTPTKTAPTTTPILVSARITPTTPSSPANVAASQGTTTEIPLCAFSAQKTPTQTTSSLLNTYTFSEPQVVLTSTTAIRLLRWLPDNRRLLVSRAIEGKFGDYIETFDLETGEFTRYSEWWDGEGIPLWLPVEQAVVFVSSGPPDYVRKLYLAHGPGSPVEELATGLATPLLSLGPDSQHIIFSSSLQGVSSLHLQQALTSEPLVTNLPGQVRSEWPYLDTWRADGSMVAMYKRGVFYLVDPEAGTACEMDLGSAEGQKIWATEAKWSSNGQYVAALVTIGEAPFRSVTLMIIDTLNGIWNVSLVLCQASIEG